MSSNNVACDPKCYTGGKGCILSENGQCLHIFENGKKNQPYKSEKTYYTPDSKGRVKPGKDLVVSSWAFYTTLKSIIDEFSKTKNSV